MIIDLSAGCLSVATLRSKLKYIVCELSNRSNFFVLVELGKVQPSIPEAFPLLDAMAASPDFKSSEPSNEVAAFLKRIETADPNSSEIDEDNSNQSWGHWQFTAGNMTITTVMKDWAGVGSVHMACKLLAATIRTCKAARHICHERNITASSFLSDVYLNSMVVRLWESWKAAGGVCFLIYKYDTLLNIKCIPDYS